MKKVFLLLIFLTNITVFSQDYRDSALGTYDCLRHEYFGSHNVFPTNVIISKNISNDSMILFLDSSSITYRKYHLIIHPDYTFNDTLLKACRYGKFYNQDSLYAKLECGGYYEYFCKQTSVGIPKTDENKIFVFFNSSSKKVTISNPEKSLVNNYIVYNTIGAVVLTATINTSQEKTELDLGQLATGSYILKLDTQKGIISTKIMVSF